MQAAPAPHDFGAPDLWGGSGQEGAEPKEGVLWLMPLQGGAQAPARMRMWLSGCVLALEPLGLCAWEGEALDLSDWTLAGGGAGAGRPQHSAERGGVARRPASAAFEWTCPWT